MLINLDKSEIKLTLKTLKSYPYLHPDDEQDVEYWDGILNKLVPILDACECQAQKQTSSPN